MLRNFIISRITKAIITRIKGGPKWLILAVAAIATAVATLLNTPEAQDVANAAIDAATRN